MKHAKEEHSEAWKAYIEALEEAKRCAREAEEAGAQLQGLRTMEGWALLRRTQIAARNAVDDWRKSTENLYIAMGIASPKE
jgi:hypothetical protein